MENKKKLKTDSNTVENFNRSAIAGVLIGFGVIINTITSSPVLGAALFSFGLLAIIQLQIPLYTGRIGFLINKERQAYFMIFFANCFAILVTIAFYIIATPGFEELLINAATLKFSKSFDAMFIYGCLCGFLIHIAVKCKTPIITIGAIMIFILIGSEHCIADFPYVYVMHTGSAWLKWILVIIGNSIGAMFAEGMLTDE